MIFSCFPPLSRCGKAARAALAAFRRNTKGVAAIEMAFVFPFMVLLYIGLVDVTNLISANRRVTLAASTIGDLVTQGPPTVGSSTFTQAQIVAFFKAITPIMEPFSAQEVKAEIFTYRKNGSAVTRVWHKDNGGTCSGSVSTSGFVNLMTDGNDLVTARVCIQIKPLFSYVFGSTLFSPEYTITNRPRNTLTLECTGCPTG